MSVVDPNAGATDRARGRPVDAFGSALLDVVSRIAGDMPDAALSPPREIVDALAAEPDHGDLGRAVARFLAAARERVTDLPGCRAVRCEHDDDVNQPGATFRLVCSGWSPSLHHHEWAVEIDHPLAICHPEDALRALDEPLAVMRDRARAAAALGLDAPLEHGDGGDDQPVEVGHLAVDRGWLAVALGNAFHDVAPWSATSHVAAPHDPAPDPEIVAERATDVVERVVAHLAAAIGRAHDPDANPAAPAPALGDDRNRVREIARGEGRPVHRVVDAHETITRDRLPIAAVVGSDVILHQRLPDAALAACAGRRLGEIAQVHPALDHRLVERGMRVRGVLTHDGTRLSLVPDLVRVGDAARAVEAAMRAARGEAE